MPAYEPSFAVTAQAFEAARARASVANYFEQLVLHMAVYDAREAGMTIREAAAALRVPKSTIARQWRRWAGVDQMPVWGNSEEFAACRRAVWAHAPEQEDIGIRSDAASMS